MQWVFLVLALWAALVELHSGTFYLAAVAGAALLTTVIGYWIRGDLLILVFLILCGMLLAAVMLYRRRRAPGTTLADLDVGQSVTISGVSQHGNQLTVSYRGTTWEAVMDDGAAVAPGDTAVISRRTDKLLHLTVPRAVAQT